MARRRTRRRVDYVGLSITSLMDMMTIILVFLLKHFAVDEGGVTPTSDLELPVSTATDAPILNVTVSVTTKAILVDGVPLVALSQEQDRLLRPVARLPDSALNGRRVPTLFDALTRRIEDVGAGASRFDGEIVLQCDRRVPFDVIRHVMVTASEAGVVRFRFVVLELPE